MSYDYSYLGLPWSFYILVCLGLVYTRANFCGMTCLRVSLVRSHSLTFTSSWCLQAYVHEDTYCLSIPRLGSSQYPDSYNQWWTSSLEISNLVCSPHLHNNKSTIPYSSHFHHSLFWRLQFIYFPSPLFHLSCPISFNYDWIIIKNCSFPSHLHFHYI